MSHSPVPTLAPRQAAGMFPDVGSGPRGRPLKVLALASYPAEAAATRHRVLQFVDPLAEQGIAVDFRPFLTHWQFSQLYERRRCLQTAAALVASTAGRCRDTFDARGADVVLLQREAMLFGPPVFEYIIARLWRKPLVLDLDDATYVPYTSPTYGRLAHIFKWFRKTDDIIRWSRVVVCGNRVIAAHVAGLGTPAVVMPTIVDTERFHPAERRERAGPVVLGWIGSHSTFRYLESILPVLQQLARSCRFRLLIVGSARNWVDVPGADVVCRPWSLSRELADFQEIDIGLYPVVNEAWSAGKSGFKAIQYMSLGLPYVMSPIGICAEIGEAGTTHLTASTHAEWHDALSRLIGDSQLRMTMGAAGRRHALAHYALSRQVSRLADALRAAASV